MLKFIVVMVVSSIVLSADPAYKEQILSGSGGTAVAMDEEWSIVGDAINKQAFVYKLDYSTMKWDDANKITLATPATTTGAFGSAVSISDETLVVTSPLKDTWQMEAGVANLHKTTGSGSQTYDTIQLQPGARNQVPGDQY